MTAATSAIPSTARVWSRYAGGLLLALLPLALLSGDLFWVNILIYTYLFAGLAVAWNIIGGFGGQFSLGHGVFFAVGAYMTAQLYLRWEVSPWLGLIPPALICAVVGALIFWPTFRLKGSFLAIATLACNQLSFKPPNSSLYYRLQYIRAFRRSVGMPFCYRVE